MPRGTYGPARTIYCTLHTPYLVVGKKFHKAYPHLRKEHDATAIRADHLRKTQPEIAKMLPEGTGDLEQCWVLQVDGKTKAMLETVLLSRDYELIPKEEKVFSSVVEAGDSGSTDWVVLTAVLVKARDEEEARKLALHPGVSPLTPIIATGSWKATDLATAQIYARMAAFRRP